MGFNLIHPLCLYAFLHFPAYHIVWRFFLDYFNPDSIRGARTNLSQSIIYMLWRGTNISHLHEHWTLNNEQWCIGSIVLYWIEICQIAGADWWIYKTVHHSVAWSHNFLFIFYWAVCVCVYVWDSTMKVVDCKSAGNTNTNIMRYEILEAKR